MLAVIGRLVLGKLLSHPELKKKIFDELRAQASRSDTRIDDAAVDAAEVVWEVAIPILIGRK